MDKFLEADSFIVSSRTITLQTVLVSHVSASWTFLINLIAQEDTPKSRTWQWAYLQIIPFILPSANPFVADMYYFTSVYVLMVNVCLSFLMRKVSSLKVIRIFVSAHIYLWSIYFYLHTVDTKTVAPPFFTIGSHSKWIMQKLFCWLT